MRVVAGKYRGRTLAAPKGQTTRPILDRVKVSLFDWLGSRLDLPGSLPPLNVLDICCGGGSLGIESLSRGARYCAFVETDREALLCLRENLANLRIGEAGKVVEAPAQTLRAHLPDGQQFGLVFLDPPYRLSESSGPGTLVAQVFDRLATRMPIADDALLLWRHDSRITTPENISEWQKTETRTWGNMAIDLYMGTRS